MNIYHERREGIFQPTVELWEKKKKQMLVSVAEPRMLRGHQLPLAPRFPRGALLGTMLRTTGPGHMGQDPVS